MNWSEIFLTNGRMSPVLIIWAFYVAVIIGTVLYYSITARLGKIVSTLMNAGAFDPDSALTVDQAGLKPGVFTKICLKSPINYKNLLVAITSDGKFYANMQYTDTAPQLKQLTAIARKKRSRIKDADNDENTEISEEITAVSAETGENKPFTKPERVNFEPLTAKYYIPKEVHVRANGIFKSSKTNVLLIVAALISLGVVIYFAVYFIDDFIRSTSVLFK